jgi:alpha,alpha-trehalose phosphorylase
VTPRGPRTERLRERLAERLTSPWLVADQSLSPEPALESIFAVANGYLGLRGTPHEGTPASDPGTLLNGFYESWPIVYPEDAYGLARTGQTIVNFTDGSVIRLCADGEEFDPATSKLLRYERVLDMRAGVLRREVEWETAAGHRIQIRSRRLASLDDRHLAAFDYEVTALDADVAITIESRLVTHGPDATSDDPRRGKGFAERVLVPLAALAGGRRAVITLATRQSGLELACGMDHAIELAGDALTRVHAEVDAANLVVNADLKRGRPLRLSKFVAYHWAPQETDRDLTARVHRTLDRADGDGYDALEARHKAHVAAFWRRSDVQVDGAPEVQLAVRFNLFQLLQATARGDGYGVPAKGLTGSGYEGHYFWDTEVYVVPFLTHTSPHWARRVLEFRCGLLDSARGRAREVGHGGALYAWRTISGEEASAFYAAGTAQYHINADIAYAMHHYNRVTGDLDFMLNQGAEVLVETARMWMDLGFPSERRGGHFCINGVTGPDEYTTVVDNNAYTNLMAKENLEVATRVIEWLQGTDPDSHARLARTTGLTEAEVDGWRQAATCMYVPRHEELGIVLQDEHFLERKRWDFERTPLDRYPLLLHYHPLELYRHQVIKQTDVVLATYLVGHHFSEDEKRRTFDYYDPLTTGDSSLSACVQSVIASEVDYPETALDYFLEACAVDLLDLHGNTTDGIHIASCGGTWLALVAGFGGLRDSDGEIRFAVRLPAEWTRLCFRIQVRGQLIEVELTPAETTYRLLEGSGLPIRHFDETLRLTPGSPARRPATDRGRPLPRAA